MKNIVLLLVGVAIIIVVGFISWRLFDTSRQEDTPKQQEETEQTSQQPAGQQQTLLLPSDKLKLSVPENWSIEKSEKCKGMAPALLETCVEGATLTPPEKLPTLFGGGKEFFTVSVSLHNNPQARTAREWFINDYKGGIPTALDKVSEDPINTYSTYYYNQINQVGQPYEDISYVLAKDTQAVLVKARVKESDGTSGKTADFTRYLPQIEGLAKSVAFQ